jgi:hypothetical protein
MKRAIAGIMAAAMLAASQAPAVASTPVSAPDRASSEQGRAANGFMGMSPLYVLIIAGILGILVASYAVDQDDTPTSP